MNKIIINSRKAITILTLTAVTVAGLHRQRQD